MSSEIASLDRVRHAVEVLRQRGVNATADRVIALTGGSKTTVLQRLRELRTASGPETPVPPAIFDIARSALIEIYEAGQRAEADRARTATERLSVMLEEQEAQIEELADENVELSRNLTSATEELQAMRSANDTLAERLKESEATVSALRREQEEDGETVADQLRAALERFQAMVEEAEIARGKRTGPNPQRGRDAAGDQT